MNDDIIRMAREAGFEAKYDRVWVDNWEITRSIERLVALARAAEQDRCCRIIFGMAGSDNVAQRTVDAIRSKE